jgi:hypothetical protein
LWSELELLPTDIDIRPTRQLSLRVGFLHLYGSIGGVVMADELVEKAQSDPKAGSGVTVDVWAVLVALGLALLVRVGVLQHVPW